MAGNRKAFEQQVYADTMAYDPSGLTTGYYRDAFKRMDDNELDAFVQRIARGEESLVVYREPGKELDAINREQKMDLCEQWGIALHERIWVDDGHNPPYLSNHVYGILYLPVRRLAQILDDKKTLPYTTNVVDELTGQAAGDSKGSSISNPEVGVLLGYNLENCLIEFMKLRGGDLTAFRAMNKSFDQSGGASIQALMKIGSEVESTATLRSYFYGMHLNNTL